MQSSFHLKSFLILGLLSVLLEPLCAQTNKTWVRFLKKDDLIRSILDQQKIYQVQILMSEWEDNTRSRLRHYSWKLNEDKYFYPASTIKLPMAVLALERANELGIGMNEKAIFDSDHPEYPSSGEDSISYEESTLGKFIEKIFLVSDNDAFNRLYDFTGRAYFNKRMNSLGFKHSKVLHRLSVSIPDEVQNAYPTISFENGHRIKNNTESTPLGSPLLMGKAYIKNDVLVEEPMDFGRKNAFSLTDQQRFVQLIFYPELFPKEMQLNITSEQRNFIQTCMGMYLSEAEDENYDKDWDAYGKYLIFGAQKGMANKNLRIYNKIGGAYGFLIDNALIRDRESGKEFFLSAIIFVNKNQTFNDDTYEYDEVGYPFFAALGKRCLEWATNIKNQ